MRSSRIKNIIIAVLVIFLLTTILTAIIAVREASRPVSSDPLTPEHETDNHISTGTTQPHTLTTGQNE